METITTSLLSGNLLKAECRVRLLNYISTAPVDCPVAVIFGHPSAINWAGSGFADAGLTVTNALWEQGYYADLIPSSEITNGALKIGRNGRIQSGPQEDAAAVLVNPQYERPATALFFRKAAKSGKTALFRTGDWTIDFEGERFNGKAELPDEMETIDLAMGVGRVIDVLQADGHTSQTLCNMRGATNNAKGFPASMMPAPSGQCRLLDGTVILVSGEKDVMGDPIRKTISVDGVDVAWDAVGVAAVRLDKEGKVEAMAAGGLKLFKTGEMMIALSERVDVALWRDVAGKWRGVLHGVDGGIPSVLTKITKKWTRLSLPVPLTRYIPENQS